MNKVILMGRLTRDVEMRQTPSGVSLARFSIAVNRRFKNESGRKGSMIAVVGSIQSRSWDGQDGKRQYATEVVVDEAYFTGEKRENASPYNQAQPDGGYNDDFDGDEFADFEGDSDDLPF